MEHKRHKDMFDPSNHADTHVVIIGLGNIGSNTAIALARMGIQHFTLVDFDTVEPHNITSQAYDAWDVDSYKTTMMTGALYDINENIEVTTYEKPFLNVVKKLPKGDNVVYISAVDSIATRRDIADNLDGEQFIIDGRMGGEQVEVYASTVAHWYQTFPELGKADTDPCTAKYISYTALIIAGFIANTLKRYLNGEEYTDELLFRTDMYQTMAHYAQTTDTAAQTDE